MPTVQCVECGAGMPAPSGRGRPRRYCSRRCQARAYRRRREYGPAAAARRLPVVTTHGGDPRDRLVAVAVELADSAGLDAVSMRVLAEHLAVPAHALYRHVRNRAELLTAMAEHVVAARTPGVAPPPHDPRGQLELLARDEWAMYRRHPWLLTVLATDRPPVGPAVLAMVDRVIDALTGAGYEPSDAFRAYLVLSGYVQGMALLIEREPREPAYDAWSSATRSRLERTGRTLRRPWLTAATRTSPATDLDTWFDFGLQRLLDGLLPGTQ